MAEQLPADRLNYTGDLEPVIQRLCDAYGVGTSTHHSVIEMGYEDCNVIIDTEQDRFMAKMFAKTRTPDDISRYTGIMQKVVEVGVHHPELISTASGEMVYTDSGITLVLMRFVEGKTFFELGRIPNDEERKAILEQAAKINNIDYEPPYLFDSWAIPNIRAMFERVQQYIDPADLPLVSKAMEQYEAIPVNELPHCFVHGDIIKTNLVKADDGGIYVLDFSVANRYPRIQELAVIAANLLHDEAGASLKERCEQIVEEYSQLSPLTSQEREHLYAYALAGVAMEFMGSHQEKHINGNDSDETAYWLRLGREGLRKALN
jgi:Ser/Thr protein kinase RdoA (MazF antagonist)